MTFQEESEDFPDSCMLNCYGLSACTHQEKNLLGPTIKTKCYLQGQDASVQVLSAN